MFNCAYCNHQPFKSSDALAAHVTLFHKDKVEAHDLLCGQPSCNRHFSRMRSFKRHLESHQEPLQCKRQKEPGLGEITGITDPPGFNTEIHDMGPETDISFIDATETSKLSDFEKLVTNAALTFVAKLYSMDTMARGHVQLIVNYLIELLNTGFLPLLESEVMDLIQNIPKRANIKKVQQMFSSLKNMFSGLETEYLRIKEFSESGAYIAPEKYIVGQSIDERHPYSNVQVVPIDLEGQFIPMRKTLRSFLELPGVFGEIMAYKDKLERTDGLILENLIQGKLWKEKIKPLFGEKIVLPLCTYFDEYEPCDPLGACSGKLKLGGVYFSIACIPPKHRSALENIFTALIFFAQDKVSNEAVFRPLVNELKFLEEEGISIVTDEGTFHVYFAMCLFLGDNLGVHSVLGFVEGFNANYSCRRCKVHKSAMQKQVRADPSLNRTVVNYEQDLVVNDPSLTGIKSKCIFNTLSSFHCIGNFCFDIMHDLEEGAWQYDMCYLLEMLVSKLKRFSLDDLNYRTQGFDYGPCEASNKPGLVTKEAIKKRKFHFSAAQTLCFVRHFGLYVGDFIQEEDQELWRFYEVIHEIVLITSAPVIHVDECHILDSLVCEHHTLFQKLFPGESLKFKHHVMTHYGECIVQVGPLANLSCYRFEASHKPFKRSAKVNSNHVNLPYTLAVKHQLKLCQRLQSQNGFISKVLAPCGNLCSLRSLEDVTEFIHLLPFQYDDLVTKVKWIKLNGSEYKVGMVLVISVGENPLFGKIYHILYDDSVHNTTFILKVFRSNSFSSKYRAYEVVEIFEWYVVNYDTLLNYVPTQLRNGPDGLLYVTHRHQL